MNIENEKKIFGFNITIGLKRRLADAASKKLTTSSGLLNQILIEWLDKYDERQENLKVADSLEE